MEQIMLKNKNIQKLITDPKTGQTYKVTPEMIIAFELCEQKIRTSMASIALSLKEIKDNQYYLIIGLTTMEEYLSERFTKSRSQAYFYMKLADAYADSPHYEEIIKLPQKILTESFKDENIVKQLQKGEFRDWFNPLKLDSLFLILLDISPHIFEVSPILKLNVASSYYKDG